MSPIGNEPCVCWSQRNTCPRSRPGQTRAADKVAGMLAVISGPETGKPKRVTPKADGELTLLVNLGGSWHEQLTPLVTHFSLPILADPFQGL